MAHKAKDNKAHGSTGNNHTSTKNHKRATKARGPFGENNGTVQHRTKNDHNAEYTKHHACAECKKK